MTEKQKIFADEYLIDLNATRAYKAAYPAVKKNETAAASATRLLKNVNVSQYVSKRMRDRQERTEITQDMVLRELAAIAFSNTTDYAKVVEKDAMTEVNGSMEPVLDSEGNPVKYRTVELELTENLTQEQRSALAVVKKGRDGYEVKPYNKLEALKLLGQHLGMFGGKTDLDREEQELRIQAAKEKLGQGEKDTSIFENIVKAAGGKFETD